MEENREVKYARDIAIVVFVIFVCIVAGIGVYIKVLNNTNETTSSGIDTETEISTISAVDYSDRQDLNEFYTEFGYTDIRNLGADYDTQSAINDNCFVKEASGNVNENLLYIFIGNVEENVSASIRIIDYTIEGDMIITDIKYDANLDKVKVVIDTTRDEYMNSTDATISYVEYDKVEMYEYGDSDYLVIHNGVLDDDSFENETTNIVKAI